MPPSYHVQENELLIGARAPARKGIAADNYPRGYIETFSVFMAIKVPASVVT